MSRTSFGAVFAEATKHQNPFPYQERLATGPILPSLIHIPTGIGKTLAIVLAWLWRRRFHPDPEVRTHTPRRLVYCLPMRNLVEQTRDVIEGCIGELKVDVQLHVMMGGDVDDEWLLHPETDAILVGTQDMLLSRALNRGYGMRRSRWPFAFGLLHSDCLWVFDEIQLMGAALPTSAQLEGFRQQLGTLAPFQTMWMSATLQPDWVATADHSEPQAVFALDGNDLSHPVVAKRLNAQKTLRQVAHSGVKEKAYPKELAALISAQHQPGTLTLVILNTVDRAVAVYKALDRHPAAKLLLHSRFRPDDRKAKTDELRTPAPSEGRIVISTQVVEAGVDLSARTLVTELAPWSSLVQRFGRCNRIGEDDYAQVIWLDVEEQAAAPYDSTELEKSRAILVGLEGKSVAPSDLPDCDLIQPETDVIRRRDLLGLFDTAPDLSGNDLDVSRFIRVHDEMDVQVFWREWEGTVPAPSTTAPGRLELCSAPIGSVKDATAKSDRAACVWDHLEDKWVKLRPPLRPGMAIMLRASEGGYSADIGWDPTAKSPVTVIEPERQEKPEAPRDDPDSVRRPETLVSHTNRVVATLGAILTQLPPLRPFAEQLALAARWHDAGKSHRIFQETMMKGNAGIAGADQEVWAKSQTSTRHSRKHFRHELASALAFRQHHPGRFLEAYLIAAHHGKVRLVIRSLPDEDRKPSPGGRQAMGVRDKERLPATDLGNETRMAETELDLTPMEMGGGGSSWLEQALKLRDAATVGPFRLAYLEAILRAADGLASAEGEREGRMA